MASKCSNCVSETKIATLPPFPHVSYSSPSSLHQHFLCCVSDTSTFVLQSVLRYPSIAYVLWFCTTCTFSRWCYIFSGCCLASCLLHRWSYEKWQTWDSSRHWGLKKLRSSSSMEEDHLNSRSYLLSSSLPSSTNRIWAAIHGTRLGKVGRRATYHHWGWRTLAAKRGGRGRWL